MHLNAGASLNLLNDLIYARQLLQNRRASAQRQPAGAPPPSSANRLKCAWQLLQTRRLAHLRKGSLPPRLRGGVLARLHSRAPLIHPVQASCCKQHRKTVSYSRGPPLTLGIACLTQQHRRAAQGLLCCSAEALFQAQAATYCKQHQKKNISACLPACLPAQLLKLRRELSASLTLQAAQHGHVLH